MEGEEGGEGGGGGKKIHLLYVEDRLGVPSLCRRRCRCGEDTTQ